VKKAMIPDSICQNDRSAHLFDVDNFACAALELAQLTKEIPKPGLGHNIVGGENPHFVQRGGHLLSGGQFPADHLKFLQLESQN